MAGWLFLMRPALELVPLPVPVLGLGLGLGLGLVPEPALGLEPEPGPEPEPVPEPVPVPELELFAEEATAAAVTDWGRAQQASLVTVTRSLVQVLEQHLQHCCFSKGEARHEQRYCFDSTATRGE